MKANRALVLDWHGQKSVENGSQNEIFIDSVLEEFRKLSKDGVEKECKLFWTICGR